MKKHKFTAIFLLLASFSLLHSQENASIKEHWRDTLLYGIESQVIEVIKQLKEREETDFVDAVIDILKNSYNTDLRFEAADYFITLGISEAESEMSALLQQWEELPVRLVQKLIQYFDDVPETLKEPAADDLKEIAESQNTLIASSAVRTLGKKHSNASLSKFFLDIVNSNSALDIRAAAVLALGDIKADDAVSGLEDILKDESEADILRRYACDSLGKIGNISSLPLIKSILSSEDPYLRSYAVSAVSNYRQEETADILIQALRDSFWRVRLTALRAIAEGGYFEAFPAVKYKMENDPESNVRTEAVKTISAFDKGEAWDYLKSYYRNSKNPVETRLTVCEQLINNNLDNSVSVIKEVIKEEWDNRNSSLLEYTAKFLSSSESAQLKDVYRRLLSHPSHLIQIYAVRGIDKNNFTDLVPEIEMLLETHLHPASERAAKLALENLQ